MSVLDYQIYILICPLVPLSPRILVPLSTHKLINPQTHLKSGTLISFPVQSVTV